VDLLTRPSCTSVLRILYFELSIASAIEVFKHHNFLHEETKCYAQVFYFCEIAQNNSAATCKKFLPRFCFFISWLLATEPHIRVVTQSKFAMLFVM